MPEPGTRLHGFLKTKKPTNMDAGRRCRRLFRFQKQYVGMDEGGPSSREA